LIHFYKRKKMYMLSRQLADTVLWSPIIRQQVRCIGFVKNIYKTINYTAPFDQDDQAVILHKLNQYSEKELTRYITKKNAKYISNHREKNGEFTCIEQLLDVEKVETAMLEKICKDLIKVKSIEGKSNNQALHNFLFKNVNPRVPSDKLQNDVRILGLRISLKKVSFALIQDCGLVSWQNIPLLDNVASNYTHYSHQNLIRLSQTLIHNLPAADFIVCEDMLPVLPKDPYVGTKVNLVKLRSYVLCQLTLSRVQSPLHILKPSLLDRLFKLKVGNERISMLEKLPDIIKLNVVEENPFYVNISEEMEQLLREERGGGEPMAGALLQAIAFQHIADLAHKKKITRNLEID